MDKLTSLAIILAIGGATMILLLGALGSPHFVTASLNVFDLLSSSSLSFMTYAFNPGFEPLSKQLVSCSLPEDSEPIKKRRVCLESKPRLRLCLYELCRLNDNVMTDFTRFLVNDKDFFSNWPTTKLNTFKRDTTFLATSLAKFTSYEWNNYPDL